MVKILTRLIERLRCRCGAETVCAALYVDAHGQWTAALNENDLLRAELEDAREAVKLYAAAHRKIRSAALREVREGIEAEYLTDETGAPEDNGYQIGIADALTVVDRMAEEGEQ